MAGVSSASLAELTFRHTDSPNIRLQKLEKLREALLRSATATPIRKYIELSITGGLPAATGVLFRLRIPDGKALTIVGPIVADAGISATAPATMSIRRNGVANGSIAFSNSTGSGTATNPNYPGNSLLEILAPSPADLSLDNVSIIIPVLFG